MELRDYLHILRKNWLIILALTLVGVGAAAAYSLTRTPLYEAESKKTQRIMVMMIRVVVTT